jgi:hypothetical protein
LIDNNEFLSDRPSKSSTTAIFHNEAHRKTETKTAHQEKTPFVITTIIIIIAVGDSYRFKDILEHEFSRSIKAETNFHHEARSRVAKDGGRRRRGVRPCSGLVENGVRWATEKG